MKRIDVVYDGTPYSVAGRELAELEQEIADIVRSGAPGWLSVNAGEGRMRPARLLITAGTPISLSSPPESTMS